MVRTEELDLRGIRKSLFGYNRDDVDGKNVFIQGEYSKLLDMYDKAVKENAVLKQEMIEKKLFNKNKELEDLERKIRDMGIELKGLREEIKRDEENEDLDTVEIPDVLKIKITAEQLPDEDEEVEIISKKKEQRKGSKILIGDGTSETDDFQFL
jgi:hypothetical protein